MADAEYKELDSDDMVKIIASIYLNDHLSIIETEELVHKVSAFFIANKKHEPPEEYLEIDTKRP